VRSLSAITSSRHIAFMGNILRKSVSAATFIDGGSSYLPPPPKKPLASRRIC
jgi:hypothetical protein